MPLETGEEWLPWQMGVFHVLEKSQGKSLDAIKITTVYNGSNKTSGWTGSEIIYMQWPGIQLSWFIL